jgi:hypothetical protein
MFKDNCNRKGRESMKPGRRWPTVDAGFSKLPSPRVSDLLADARVSRKRVGGFQILDDGAEIY